ncbi:PAS domain S-box protein [Desulfotignum phosphitoxidans]|uniref:histidine kinase n=1 Tax=Desulfotignum phosphitoxidans DSM 13687 TaxID=1286635 RepID=S0G701_9BACT|nr:PAS domain S-box protein [Desulfotignum phosphitoxidans]EMS80717.1 multi-sensor hybrid histidine kinase [Desulfotignum phosphitoxidans DSM 13687]
MAEKPTYEELKKRVAELEQKVDQNNTAAISNPPELFSVLMEAFRYIPRCKTFEDAAREIFEHCKKLTGARSGYVALLSENGEGNEVLFLDAGGMPCDVDPNLPMPIRGLREIAYKTKEVAFDNSFSESPWMEYMPEGHVRLENVLFAPLNIEKKTVGVIGIANKDGGFNEFDVQISKILGDLAAVALYYARSQENLRENETKLRSMLNASPLAIVLLNRSGCILDSNEEHASRLNVSRDEILGRCLWELLPKEVLAHRRRQVEEVFETGKPYTGEDRRNDIWNQYHIHPAIIDQFGKVQAVIVEAIDITEQKQQAEALEESKAFLDNMSDIAYIADDQGNLTWVNSAARRMTGFLPEELIGKPFLPLFIEEDHASLMDVYQRTLNGESLENTLTFKTGITCHFTSLPKRSSQGDIIGTFGVARDISKRLAAEHALRTSEARLKRAQKMAKVGNWEYDIATGKVWGSEEAFRIYGIERMSEFLPLDEVESHITDAKRVYQALEDLIVRNKPYDIEFQINPKNRKESIHVHSMAEMVFDGNGKPEKVVGVIQDITESKQAEKILQKNHEMLKRTEAMASIGSWEWDAQHDQTYWSEELFKIFGRGPAEGAPPFAEQSELYASGDIQRLRDAVEICVKRGTPYEIELGAVRPDGEIRHCVSRGQPQYDENGNVFRLTGSFQDITDRKQDELERNRLEARLSQAQKMESIGSLAGGIAHDFNNILFPIVGLSEMMLDDFPPGSLEQQNLNEIFLAGKRGRDLIQQILSFSRQTNHQPIPVHIQKILKEVMKLCRATIPADITVSLDIQTDCGPVMADPTQIHQIAMNLITNAYHAVEHVGGTISIRLMEKDVSSTDDPAGDLAPGRYAMVSVSDTGIGIDGAVINKIFDPYFTTKEKGRGTGLGLATVYGIVSAHGGDIRVISDVGKGAAFHVYLPLMEKTQAAEPEKTMTPLPTGTEHILLVDDEKSIVHLEKQMLERLGYQTSVYTSSRDALAAFKTEPPRFDLVITDMNMPDMNGMQLATQLNAIRPDIPIILCTGFSERIDNKKAKTIGIRGLLMKPAGMKDFAQKVQEVLDTTKKRGK